MTFIGTYSDGASDNADLILHKASGSGPSTIKMLKSKVIQLSMLCMILTL